MTLIKQQIISFTVTVGLGMAMGLIFDLYFCLRNIIKPSKLVIHFVDVLIWLFLTVFVFTALLLTNWADVRLYVFIGIGMGLIIYYLLLSKEIKKILTSILLFLFRTIKLAINLLALPLKLISKAIRYIIGFINLAFVWLTNPARKIIYIILQSIKLKIKKILKGFRN